MIMTIAVAERLDIQGEAWANGGIRNHWSCRADSGGPRTASFSSKKMKTMTAVTTRGHVAPWAIPPRVTGTPSGVSSGNSAGQPVGCDTGGFGVVPFPGCIRAWGHIA